MFCETRVWRKKRTFDYECADDSSHLSAEDKFISQFFFVLNDFLFHHELTILREVKWYNLFGFLCNANSLKQCHIENDLEKHCK